MDRALIERLTSYLTSHRARALRWFTEHPDHPHPGDDLPLFVGVGEGRAHGRTDLNRLDYSRAFQHGVFYRNHWRAACDAAGVPATVTFYDLRHFHISANVAALGKDGALTLAEIQQRAGHASKVMTLDRYSHTKKLDHDTQRAGLDALAILVPLSVDNVTRLHSKFVD
jgi:integrase